MSFYSHYRGRNAGRMIHFMCHYNRNIADDVKFGSGKVELWGDPFATVTWSNKFGEADVPEFTFVGYEAEFHTQQQLELRQEAIDDAIIYKDSPAEQIEVNKIVLQAIIPDAYRDAYFWNSCDSEMGPKYHGKEAQKEPKFYASAVRGINHKESLLFFETCLHRYFWYRDYEVSAWLLDGLFYQRKK